MTTDILFVDHAATTGGGQFSLLRYLSHRHEHSSQLLLLRDGPLEEKFRETGVPVNVPSAGTHPLVAIRQAFRKTNPTLVVANSMQAAFYTWATVPRALCVVYVRQHLSRSAVGFPKATAYDSGIRLRTRSVIANSFWTASRIPGHLPCTVAFPVSGIDASAVAPPRPPRSASRYRIAVVGRFQPWKGQDRALEVAEALASSRSRDEFEFVFFGDCADGSEDFFDACKTRIDALGKLASFAGFAGDISQRLRSFDALLHLPHYPEPFGQVVVQALAAGCDVASASGGGASEILATTQLGVAVEHYSPRAVVDILLAFARRKQSPRQDRVERLAPYLDSNTIPALEAALLAEIGLRS